MQETDVWNGLGQAACRKAFSEAKTAKTPTNQGALFGYLGQAWVLGLKYPFKGFTNDKHAI